MTSTRTVAQKMGIRTGARTHLVNAPEQAVDALTLPAVCAADSDLDYIHLFAITQRQLDHEFPRERDRLRPGGMLWVSWPKGRRLGSDLTLPTVIAICYGHGLVESTCLRVDDTWAGLKFTHPKPGKVYCNSHGTLPGQ